MTAAVIGCLKEVDDIGSGAMSKLLSLAVPTAVGMLIYFAATFLLRLDEAKLVVGMLKKSRKEKA